MIISLCNFKGGVAKTSSTVNIGAALTTLGKKVLLIDTDPQYNLTTSLGIEQISSSLYESLTTGSPLPIQTIYPGLDLIPSSIDLTKAEIELASEFKREDKLTKLLEPIKDQYDYILIDCPPSLGLLTINALVASDQIFVPIEAEFLALKGYTVLNQALDKIGLVLDRLFVTKYDGRTVLHRDIANALETNAKDRLFKTKIRRNVSLAEANAQGQDIFRYAPDSNGAIDYLSLTKEIIDYV